MRNNGLIRSHSITAVALCQAIPGAIAVNMAAYVGLKARGIAGMLAGFAGFIMPCIFYASCFSAIFRFQGSRLTTTITKF
jgi:chromate transporter